MDHSSSFKFDTQMCFFPYSTLSVIHQCESYRKYNYGKKIFENKIETIKVSASLNSYVQSDALASHSGSMWVGGGRGSGG